MRDYRLMHPILGQIVRFGIAGGLSTVIYSIVYLALADFVLPAGMAVAAVPPAFLAALVCGFFLHRNWSFRGHASESGSRSQPFRFVIVQLFGLVLNTGFTWLITAAMGLPNWVALLPVISITPAVTFVIQRQWVFAR